MLPNILRRSRRALPLAAAALALAGAFAITGSRGPGLDPDSASYLGAAESIAHGRGARIPIATWATPDSSAPLAHFPPGYPIALAIPIRLGADTRSAARAVNCVAAAASLGILAAIVTAECGAGAAAVLVLLIAITPAILDVHLSALSEPLFLALLAALLAAMRAAARASTRRAGDWRVAALGAIAGCAALVRYAGIAACAAAGLWAILLPGDARTRARRALLALAPMGALVGAWVLHTHRVAGTKAIREIGTYGALGATLAQGRETFVEWLVPVSIDYTLSGRSVIAALVAIALVALVVAGWRRAGTGDERKLVVHPSRRGALVPAVALLAGAYAVTILASRLVADRNIPFDGRILSPLLLLLETLAVSLGSRWWRGATPAARAVLGAGVLAWSIAAFGVAREDAAWALDEGADFAGPQWTDSPLLRWAGDHAADRPLYANWPAVIYFHLHRPAHELPTDSSERTVKAFSDTLRARRGVAIVFDAPTADFPTAAALTRAGTLRVVVRDSDGVILAPPDSAATRGH